ncbi:hypothetical protein KJ751_03850 [Patescibacteria group bacterium]|nr:hypothetical protein [Patescibacteria group bacterium]
MAKAKKQNQKPTKKNSPSRDEYTVVLEDLRSQFGVFGEGLGYVSDKMDEVNSRLANVETELEFVKNELGIIRHNQVTRDEFRLLETRVVRLERAK